MTGGRHKPQDDDQAALNAALHQAATLWDRLADIIGEPTGRGPDVGTIGRHAPESKEPWNPEVADVYFLIYHGARELADDLRRHLELPLRPWGTADPHAALTLIGSLAARLDPQRLADTRATTERWVSRARAVRDIDEADVWRPIPRNPGSAPPLCPYCHTRSLRMSLGREQVRCFFPDCRDFDGNRTAARMMASRLDPTRGQLVFGDGTIIAYGEADEPDRRTRDTPEDRDRTEPAAAP